MQVLEDIRKGEKDPCEDLIALKRLIRNRLYQGSRSVEVYHKEMEMDLIRAQIGESEEDTLARFLHGINRECKMRKSASRNTYSGTSRWKGKEREKEKARREKSPKKGSKPLMAKKKSLLPPTPMAPSTSSIKRVMIVKDNGEVESESSIGEVSTSSEATCLNDDSYYEEDFLIMRRCLILENLSSMIIYGGCCVNITCERLVKKLALPTIVHPKSYRLQWISEKREFIVDKKVVVMFILGGYEDRVVCDVVPMEAIHLLLRRPWKSNKEVIHDRVTN
ncbi:hypothetical protein CR513_13433, partial [Mucuna pruriens]